MGQVKLERNQERWQAEREGMEVRQADPGKRSILYCTGS